MRCGGWKKEQADLHSDGWHKVKCCCSSLMSSWIFCLTLLAWGRSQFLQALMNLPRAVAWPTASLNPWPTSCATCCSKYTRSSARHQHPWSQILVGSDTPPWFPVRNRRVPHSPCGFQLILTHPHFPSLFPFLMLALLTSGPAGDCVTSSSDYAGTSPYKKSLISDWNLANTQCCSRWTET